MAEPLRLLVLSKDPTLFTSGDSVQGDARRRHIRYAEVMRSMLGSDSDIRMITYTTRRSGHRYDELAPGLTLYGTSSINRAAYLADSMRLTREILRSDWRPTAITTQTPWEEGALGAHLAQRLGVRFLPQLHLDLFADEWRSEALINRWRASTARRVLLSATRVRVVSEQLRQSLTDRLEFDPSRVDVIPVGVNFEPASLPVGAAKAALDPRLAGRRVVLFVGRLAREKNLRLWLDVATDVLVQMPEVRFAIVGDGDQEPELRQLIERRQQTDSILLLGPIGHERLPHVYRAADLFLLSSNHEGFGRVVLEAAFASVPSVATRCAGPQDIVKDGVSGYLVEKADRKGLVDATINLLVDEEKRCRFGVNAFQSAHAQYGLDALAAQLVTHWSRP